jgi:hypothetical protein
MEKESEKYFAELKEELTEYVKIRTELFKVNTYEKISKVMSVVLLNLMVIISGYFTLLFISMMLGFILSRLTHSFLIGFGIITALYLLLFLFLAVFRREKIQNYFTNIIIKILFSEYEEKD